MCSLSAVSGIENVEKTLYGLVFSGQNRGDESTGFGILLDNRLEVLKRMKSEGGIIKAYLDLKKEIDGNYIDRGIGQTRYSTSGKSDKRNAQPFKIKGKSEFIISHNGTISNSKELKEKYGLKCFSQSDTEVGGCVIAQEKDLIEGIERLSENAVGAYNLNLLSRDGRVVVFRDPLAFHPLWYGFDENGGLLSASENYPLYAVGCYNPIELKPGEGIIADGKNVEKFSIDSPGKKECFFEVIYFMKPGSSCGGKEVSKIRHEIGSFLGKNEDLKDAIVVPVEDSGSDYAEGFAEASGLELVRGLMKNRGERVYMDPAERSKQNFFSRKEKAKLKHVAIPKKVKDKIVLVIDDSIVRCDTSTGIAENLFATGAKEVHFRIASPPQISGCIYGLDHSKKAELAAAYCTSGSIEDFIAKRTKANSVNYMRLEDLKPVLKDNNDHCFACITGEYPTRVPEECRSAIEL